jgi:hypothetical protein
MKIDQRTLCESMTGVSKPDDFDYAIANFLDRFKREPGTELLMDEPPVLRDTLQDDGLADAYVAAVAAHLCQQQGFSFPKWVGNQDRIKKRPWFAAKTPNLKAILLQESPAAFRVRNLFVSANALSRA